MDLRHVGFGLFSIFGSNINYISVKLIGIGDKKWSREFQRA